MLFFQGTAACRTTYGSMSEVVMSPKLKYDDMLYGHVASIDISCVRVDKTPQQSAPLASRWRPRNPRGSEGMYQCTFRFSRTQAGCGPSQSTPQIMFAIAYPKFTAVSWSMSSSSNPIAEFQIWSIKVWPSVKQPLGI